MGFEMGFHVSFRAYALDVSSREQWHIPLVRYLRCKQSLVVRRSFQHRKAASMRPYGGVGVEGIKAASENLPRCCCSASFVAWQDEGSGSPAERGI